MFRNVELVKFYKVIYVYSNMEQSLSDVIGQNNVLLTHSTTKTLHKDTIFFFAPFTQHISWCINNGIQRYSKKKKKYITVMNIIK